MLTGLAYLLVTYLIAAIPFGLVITTLWGDDADIRRSGSGNIGATNVARVYNWNLAAPVVMLDIGKGLLPVILARWLWPDVGVWWPSLVAVVAFLAHCFSVYLEFRGGKGVATGAGGLLAITPWTTLPTAAIWVTLLALTGRSSIAALGSAVALVGLTWTLNPDALPVVLALALGIAWTHATNIRRLVRGEEKQVMRPVRWGRTATDEPNAEQVLVQGPSGTSTGASVWKEEVRDPLDTDEVPKAP
jgi:glycerol-3-phosphate acyltransferase PlsY